MTTEAKLDKQKIEIDLSKAVRVANRVELRNVRLIKSSCELKPSGTKGPYEVSLSEGQVTIQLNKDKGTLVVLPSLKLAAFVIKDKKDEPDFEVSATFALTYTLDNFEGLEEDHFQAFGHTNGIFNAWPYWREFAQNTILRMGLPALTIPVFRLPSPKKDNVKATSPNKPAKKTSKKKDAKKKEKAK